MLDYGSPAGAAPTQEKLSQGNGVPGGDGRGYPPPHPGELEGDRDSRGGDDKPAQGDHDKRKEEGNEKQNEKEDDQSGEEEDEEESDEDGDDDEEENSIPFDPSKVKVEPVEEDYNDDDEEGRDSDDDVDDDDDSENAPIPGRFAVKAEVRDGDYQEGDWEDDGEVNDIDPEDDEAVWEQEDDPDFDVDKVIKKRRASRAAKAVKTYYDESDDDNDEWEPQRRRRRAGGAPRRTKMEPQEGEEVQCEKCRKMWPSLPSMLKHISHIKPCRQHYGEDRIQEMRAVQRRARYRSKDPARAERDRQQRMRNYYENRLEKLQKSREYYQRNKDKITLKKRLSYKVEDDAEGTPLGRANRTIRVGFPEPEVAMGTVRWNRGEDERDMGMCEFGTNEDPSTKLDMESAEDVQCMPEGYSLTGRMVYSRELDLAHGFVGLAVNDDKESVEVRPLLARSDINLMDLRELFHAIMAVTGATMKDILSDKGSSISVISYNRNLLTLRNRYSKEIIANNNQMPEVPKPICFPGRSRETHFLSAAMEDEVPADQLLVNFGLAPNDMSAVALECRFDGSEASGGDRGNKLIPIFTVSMEDWRITIRFLFTILINWVGNKDLLEEMWLATPCGVEGERMIHHELKEECYQNCLQPKTVSVCEHCGKTFVYNAYIQSEKAKYDKHVAIHNTTCRICGETFPNMPAKRNHQRTHRESHFPCTAKKNCKYVGTTQEALDKHVQYFHTRIICELCGKDYTNKNSLSLHIALTHNKQVQSDLVCSFCGKVGFCHEYELKRHEKRHRIPNSNVNKWMENKSTGFVCPLSHDNCKRYFKKASYVRKHIRMFAHEDPNWHGKELPENLRKKVPKKGSKKLAVAGGGGGGSGSGGLSMKKVAKPVSAAPSAAAAAAAAAGIGGHVGMSGVEAALAASGVVAGYLPPPHQLGIDDGRGGGGGGGGSYKQEPTFEAYERS